MQNNYIFYIKTTLSNYKSRLFILFPIQLWNLTWGQSTKWTIENKSWLTSNFQNPRQIRKGENRGKERKFKGLFILAIYHLSILFVLFFPLLPLSFLHGQAKYFTDYLWLFKNYKFHKYDFWQHTNHWKSYIDLVIKPV